MKLNHPRTSLPIAGAVLLACSATLPAWAAQDYSTTVQSQGPVGYWRLNETTLPLQSIPSAANAGSLGAAGAGTYSTSVTRGEPGALAGVSNPSAKFNNPTWDLGTYSSTVDVPFNAALNPNGPFSIEFWAKPPTMPSDLYATVSSMNFDTGRAGYLVYLDGANQRWQFRVGRVGSTTATVVNAPAGSAVAGAWQHVVGVFNGTQIIIYVNGAPANTNTLTTWNPNDAHAFRIGATTIPNRGFNGWIDEVAFYNTALSASAIAAHYSTATSSGAGYGARVLADSPVGYWRLDEPGDPLAINLGSLGAAANGTYVYNALPGQAGPASPTYPGFEAANKSVGFDGSIPSSPGSVSIPALKLKTNTVTITGWVKANGSQKANAGIVFCNSGTTVGGLMIAGSGGLGLGYNWNGDTATTVWWPSSDAGLPLLQDGVWAFVALAVEPTQAEIYVANSTDPAGFTGATNVTAHLNMAFDGATLIGENASGPIPFVGAIDEVSIFKRVLSAGEVYSQFAAAVGNVPVKIFADPQAPINLSYLGDTITLAVDAGGTPPLTYQWYKGTTALTGQTSASLTITNAQTSDAGDYHVVVQAAVGSSQTSQSATLLLNPVVNPTIADSSSSRTLYPGGTLDLHVTASGGGLSYYWSKDGSLLASVTSSRYLVPSVDPTNGGSYSVLVSNSVGTATAGPMNITVVAVAPNSYESIIVAAKPEGWWRLDETGGTNLWDAMGRHDGYYTSMSSTVPPVGFGVPGAINNDPDTAITFTPASMGVGVVPFSPALNPTVFTVEAWVKTTVTGGNIVPLSTSYGSKGWLWQTVNGYWNGNGASIQDYGATTAAITPGIWTHLIMTFDISRYQGAYPYQYFINGKGDAGYVWSGPDLNTAGPLIIGAHGVSATRLADTFFDGQVDEVAIYPRILTSTEIAAHFQGRFGSSTAPYFVSPLTSLTVPTDKPVTFTTQVQGSVPMGVQWSKNGSPIAGATTTTLSISSAAVTDAGTYTLTATNAAGTNSLSATLTVVPPVGFANVTNGLVLHLRFDGNLTDATGRGNNGTAVGSPTYVQGIVGNQALQYSTVTISNYIPTTNITVGSANYVDLGSTADLQFDASASFTVGLWVKVPTNYNGGDLPFIGNETGANNNPGWDISPTYGGGGWQFCLNDGVTAGLAVTNNINVSDANAVLSDGMWHYLALVVDRAAHVASMYADGVLAASRDVTGLGSINTGAPMTIGQDPTGQYPTLATPSANDLDVWSGIQTAILDDLGVWRRALTQMDVINIYSAGSTGHRSFDTVAPPITITVTKTSSGVTLSWAGGTLLESTTLGPNAVWAPVPGAYGPTYTVTPGTGNKFYRVLAQ